MTLYSSTVSDCPGYSLTTNDRSHALMIVPTLRVGMQPVTLSVTNTSGQPQSIPLALHSPERWSNASAPLDPHNHV